MTEEEALERLKESPLKKFQEDQRAKCKHGQEFAYYSFPKMFKLCKCCGIAECFGAILNANLYCISCDEIKN